MKGLLKFLAVSGVVIAALSGSINTTYADEIETYYDEEGNMKIVENETLEVPEVYEYTLTDDEQKVLDEALAADGKEAAELVNSLENDYAFLNVARSVMDSYFEVISGTDGRYQDYDVKIDSRYKDFKKGLDNRAEELIAECDQAFAEKSEKKFKLKYMRDRITVYFDASVSDGEITSFFEKMSNKVDIYNYNDESKSDDEKIEWLSKYGKGVVVYLRNSQSIDKMIEDLSNMKGVKESRKVYYNYPTILYPDKVTYTVKLKRFKTVGDYKFKNKLITTYSQMSKIKRKYKNTAGYNKDVYKRLKKYNKEYFSRGAVILNTETVFKGKNVKISSVVGKSTGYNEYALTLTRKITGKKTSKEKQNVHCIVEITKKMSEWYTSSKIK